ncbi:hypothetical protein HanXRQr2_Chr06g0257891 [Helianthus annuus]|uniref:Uncharacterized protein n=1 Tax=Helianthus annuus TaxID=4232 RepID=A0A9K3NJU8_HELAN|nr:hypothetical protein HanXRQr2_Chr06g0257891 [Helianthus annuus]KAJ0932610.1 hypothetical protein HanPSC8_Chr04g0175611 [Helianthus annuus]
MRSGAPFSLITPHNPPNTTTGGVMRQKKLAALWISRRCGGRFQTLTNKKKVIVFIII